MRSHLFFSSFDNSGTCDQCDTPSLNNSYCQFKGVKKNPHYGCCQACDGGTGTYTLIKATDVLGKDWKGDQMKISTPQCRKACDLQENCTGFEVQKDSGNCELHTGTVLSADTQDMRARCRCFKKVGPSDDGYEDENCDMPTIDKDPLKATIGAYPGSASDYVPQGSASAAINRRNRNVEFRWDLGNVRPTLKATLGVYPGSAATPPTGTVAVEDQPDGSIKVYYNFKGLAENAASGGLHIHTGTSCLLPQDVGGHYWKDSTRPDPWNSETMYSVSDGAAKGSFLLNSGHTFGGNDGHVVVVHDDAGARVACGVLGVASGGVHIHSGTSCSDAAAVGGHYWNKTAVGEADPWTTTYKSGTATSAGTASVKTGYTFQGNVNHAVVVHSAADGSRIGCGVLNVVAGHECDGYDF